jgi:hypothetical protein
MARLATLARFEVSGEILSEDTIALLTAADCKLPGADMDVLEFAAAWDLLSDEWQRIRQDIGEYDTERLRRRWIMPLLDLLGHNPQFLRSHPIYADGRAIPLTHRSGDVPLWFLDYKQQSDEKLTTGRRRNSPHELFQEYLDLTDDNWGILCNGKTIRLLHDYHKTLTRNYVEADLESIFEALDIDAFRVVWRIFRAESFQAQAKGVRRIEKLCEQSRQEGAEIGKELRKQVLEAIRTLGNGFLAADHTGELQATLVGDPEAKMLFYQALLRIVYRLLFLLYIENKPGWTPAANPVWASSYSISRLREQAEEATSSRADGEDHWEGLKVIFGIIRNGSEFFDIHPYGGELFDTGKLWRLDEACLRNSDLLLAIRLLTFFEDKKKKVSYRVNFRTIRIDALGSVYEALLDVAPAITPNGIFTFAEGTERKLTGSYYTPPELVAELIKSALVPVIEDRLKDVMTKAAKEAALLAIKVVDPACGSGAFLVQALDKLSEQLCLIRKEGEEPSELDIREARRDVVTHCIHGVDLNPMAVELCKFTLWLHVAHPKLPLSYLEPRIKHGNALIGVPLKKQVEAAKAKIEKEKAEAIKRGDMKAAAKLVYTGWPDNVPDEAFDPVTGDDKATAKRIKERNKKEREQVAQTTLGDDWIRIGRLADWFGKVNDMPEDTIEAVRKKSEAYAEFVRGQAYEPARFTADTWCAAFFWPLDDEHEIAPTTKWYRAVEKNPSAADYHLRLTVKRLAEQIRFFHWELEFPAVFAQGGFDCVLGNPPWERIKLQEQEFFASRAVEISTAVNTVLRRTLIDTLGETNPALMLEFEEARHVTEAESKFIRQSRRYPLTAFGDVNTYALFAEMSLNLPNEYGRAGMVVPIGIATDDTTKAYFSHLVSRDKLRSLLGYENEGNIFVGVHHAFKFALLTISTAGDSDSAELAFFCRRINDIYNPIRRFTLRQNDFALLNPNTRTCPVYRTRTDADLTKSIYSRVPVVFNEHDQVNPWEVSFRRVFDMNKPDVIKKCITKPQMEYVRMYEAKMMHLFDHRFGSYASRNAGRGFSALPETTFSEYTDSNYQVQPFYWIAESEVTKALRDKWNRRWLLGYRDITSNVLIRTANATILPYGATDFTIRLLFPSAVEFAACLLGNLNSVVFDYTCRQAVAGTHLSDYITKQLPLIPPNGYYKTDDTFISPRVLELVYTAWDIKPFAEDLGNDGPPFVWDEDRRALLRAELDAYYARLYGLNRKQLRYILDPHGLSDRELEDILDPWEDPTCSGPHLLPANPTQDFPGETFRVLKNNEEKPTEKGGFGEYRTRRLVLEAWARLETELGPVKPINYREMLENQLPPPVAKSSTTVVYDHNTDLVLFSPDYTPQERLDF